MASILQHTENLTVIEDACTQLIIENQCVKGVHLKNHGDVFAQAVILTTGTYMTSTILRGHNAMVSGPEDQPTIQTLSAGLQEHGVRLFRLKKQGHHLEFYGTALIFQKLKNSLEHRSFSVLARLLNQKIFCLLTSRKFVI